MTDRPGGNGDAELSHCTNCGAVTDDRFCPSCGQSTTDIRRPAVSLLTEYFDGLFAWDGRLLTTLRHLYTRPGQVAADYVGGKRAGLTPPIRLYLIMVVAFFAILALAGIRVFGVAFSPSEAEIRAQTPEWTATRREQAENLDRLIRESGIPGGFTCGVLPGPDEFDSSGMLIHARGTTFMVRPFMRGETPPGRVLRAEDAACYHTLLQAFGWGWLAPVFIEVIRRPGSFEDRVSAILSQSFIAMVLVFAALNLLLHPRRKIVEHIVYSFYWHTAMIPFLLVLALMLQIPAGLQRLVPICTLLAAMTVFSLWQERRFYKASMVGLALRFPVLLAGYLTSMSILTLALLRASAA
ncbi:DUF3667 domain-containing protein [Maricaulis sp.]|uniref:DUF3667 domain-containing protein n=1 Tax=Maricaulis sp. TaxID=1486257 RepID=UPI001B2655CF|nr:DUF3667 domain-containing protein [Maricaulis sp.]MBO6766200.1 DUF3667 domain-containing protein [Maricaulis sp.]